MRHPDDGVLRRLLDEPDAIIDADRSHVARCDDCRRSLDEMRTDAAAVARSLAVDVAPDLDAALLRLRGAPTTTDAVPIRVPFGKRRARSSSGRPFVAGVAVAAVLAVAGTAAAAGWIPVFRTEEVAPISIRTADLSAIPDLHAYGDLRFLDDPEDHRVPDARSAAEETGIEVPIVDELPDGVTGPPAYRVITPARATFTFSADRAARAAAEAGEPLPEAPPGLDGSQVRLQAGPGVAAVWTQQTGLPGLIVARAVAPTADTTSGVPFVELREFLLSIPGLPDDVARAIRSLNADGATLPIPVPADRVEASETEVGGRPATLLVVRGRIASAVVWVDDGHLNVVGGSLDPDEVLTVARGLR